MNKLFRYHPRILLSSVVGAGIFLVLPAHWTTISRVLAGWDCGVALFLGLIYSWMTGLSAEHIRSRYIDEDPSSRVILVVIVAAALLSVVAIVEPPLPGFSMQRTTDAPPALIVARSRAPFARPRPARRSRDDKNRRFY